MCLICTPPYKPADTPDRHPATLFPSRSALTADASKPSLTYAQAGVSVDAGNSLVDAIKPYVRSTRRVGADAEIGGFGGVFDLKAVGYQDPVLVSGTDGVGTKLRVAMDAGIHDTVGESVLNYHLCILVITHHYDRHRLGGNVCERSARPGSRATVFPRLLRVQQAGCSRCDGGHQRRCKGLSTSGMRSHRGGDSRNAWNVS